MTNSRNPSPNSRRSSVLDLVKPAFVLLHLVLLPVALLERSDAAERAERDTSEVGHEQDRAGTARRLTPQA